MSYSIKDEHFLKKIVWLDSLAGGATALICLLGYVPLTTALGVTTPFILTVATVNLLYAILAFVVAAQKPTSVGLFRVLVYANWAWTAISILMIFIYFGHGTSFGNVLLVCQPIFVGGLAYIENSQIITVREA